jgi:hypothetical protein
MAASRNPRRRPRTETGFARDRYGRPLPRGSADLRTERRTATGDLSIEEAFDLAVEHFDRGRFFEAHECFELIWRRGPADERLFWKGLAQVAVGLCHCQRDNARGALALLARGALHVVRFTSPYRGVDVQTLIESCRQVAEAIRREGASDGLAFPRFPLA